jgi:RNA polymerase sigma factor (sigma-70 family)
MFIYVITRLHIRMRDGEVGAAIAVGDPSGLAEAWDKYASALYMYCRSLLSEPAEAADAVQDTFVIAASELAGLDDRRRLRPWLYAVARNESLRRTGGAAAAPLEAVLLDGVPWVTGEAGRADLGALLRSAACGLGAGEQDLIRLRWQQGLDVAEIATILGVSRDYAHALLSRAQDQLETAVGALLVARAGRYGCARLSALLEDSDGQLNAVTRKRIDRHIRRCRACDERRRRELAPVLPLDLGLLAVPPAVAMPADLRARVLRLANSNTPGAVAYRAQVTGRTAPLRNHGFPKPMDPPGRRWRPSRQRQAAAAAFVAIAGAVAAATLLTLALAGRGSGGHDTPALAGRPSPLAGTGASTGAAASPGVVGSARPTRSGRSSPSPVADGPRPVAGSSTGGPWPGVGRPAGGSASVPRPSATRSAPGRGSPTPSARSAPATATIRVTVTATPRLVQGTLTVTPASITPLPGRSDTLTLTAWNGPVTWSITLSPGLVGELTVVPSSGRLAAGESATVTVTPGEMFAGGDLTVEPGGITVTVASYL